MKILLGKINKCFSFITFRKSIQLFFVVLFFISFNLFSQDPTYFQITNENGLPSNEVYCVLQDNKGFIWFGCDAGIYKYDGVRYTQYKSNEQRSRAFSGLTLSSTGKVYAYNFSGQLFYAENDSLYCLKDWNDKVSNIVCDDMGNLWVCGEKGISKYNEQTKKWKLYTDFDGDGKTDKETFTRSCKFRNGIVSFINTKGLGFFNGDTYSLAPFAFPQGSVCGEYESTPGKDCVWLFHRSKNYFYKCIDFKIEKFESRFLSKAIVASKFNDMREMADGSLYLPGYAGLVIYNPQKDTGEILYANKAISYVIIDRENNYWLSTLQSGLMRIPSIAVKQWKFDNNEEVSKRVNKIITVDENIYATNISGQLASLNVKSNSINVFSSDRKADIQCLFYDTKLECVCFNINNTLYQFKNKKISSINSSFPTAKYIYSLNNQYVVASSFGLYIYDDLVNSQAKEWLLKSWTREVYFDKPTNRLFAATNSGLIVLSLINNKWIIKDTLLKGKQINSLTFDEETKHLYALSFDDKLYSVDRTNQTQEFFELPSQVHASQIRLKNNIVFIACNAGLYRYDLSSKKHIVFNRLDGLSSNEIMYMDFVGGDIYLATSKGINRLPLATKQHTALSKLYLDAVFVDNENIDTSNITLNHNQLLSLKLSGLSFSSNSTFNYAYRIVSTDSSWVKLPASIESIEFQSLPYGDFILEVKLIDHLGKDSENLIVLKGQVKPPFWQRTWFMILEALLLVVILLVAFKYRIKKIEKKQAEELKRINLENELRLVQQSALKAQMNPHFIFNVLNSIKGYIYDNDKKNAVLYLSNFAELMRKILHNSSYDTIKLSEELEILKIYIDLEAMQFEGDFEYHLKIADNIEIDAIQIPSLLIQPYIENAFKHGLRHKSGAKKLSLGLIRENNSIKIKIIDNGIGIAASKKINESTNRSHQSFASIATERRIELLNNNSSDIVHVKMLDDLNEQNVVIGTIVVLTIQLN